MCLSVMMSRLFGKFFFYGQTVLVHFSLAVYPLFLSLSSWLLFLPIKDLVMWWLRLKLPCVIVQLQQALEIDTILITMNLLEKFSVFFFLNSLRVTIAKVFSLRILLFSDQISRSIVYHLTTSLLQNIFCFMEQRRLQIVFSAEFSVEISLFIKTLFAFSKKLVEIYVTTAPWNSSSRRNRIEILFTRGVL